MKETVKIVETFQNIKRLQFHKDKTKKSILRGKNVMGMSGRKLRSMFV